MKPFLVDVPVKLNIWIRPECQKMQFEVIKKARPSIMFVVSDGGRNEQEWEAIRKSRKMIDEGIDWDCTVYRMYEDVNNGLFEMGKKSRSLIWDNVDRCIFLEDDIIPSVSFFRYCAELLEKYKDDLRINTICGMNHLGVSENVNTDYFFSRQGSIWGCATWKRVHDAYYDFDYAEDPYVMSVLKQRMKRNPIAWEKACAHPKQRIYKGHVAGAEFFKEFAMYGHNQVQIIPRVNLVSNMGCTANSAHSDSLEQLPKGIRRVFNMKTYEIEFPMKHAKYVMPDVEYERKRNRIMGYGHKWVTFWRKLERVWIKLKHGEIKYLFSKLKTKLSCK